MPNAAAQARQTAGATEERTLFAVACSRLLGARPILDRFEVPCGPARPPPPTGHFCVGEVLLSDGLAPHPLDDAVFRRPLGGEDAR
jgi:hypothetical protein